MMVFNPEGKSIGFINFRNAAPISLSADQEQSPLHDELPLRLCILRGSPRCCLSSELPSLGPLGQSTKRSALHLNRQSDGLSRDISGAFPEFAPAPFVTRNR